VKTQFTYEGHFNQGYLIEIPSILLNKQTKENGFTMPADPILTSVPYLTSLATQKTSGKFLELGTGHRTFVLAWIIGTGHGRKSS